VAGQQEVEMATKTPEIVSEELMHRYLQAWSDHDPDAIASMMTPDAIFEASSGPEPWGARYVGRETIRKAVEESNKAAEAVTDYRHGQVFIVGNHAFAEWTSSYVRPSTGEEVCIHGMDLFEIRDGLVHRKIAYRKSPVAAYVPVRKA
jgi:uncharacterized protein (TIGR02246 family)